MKHIIVGGVAGGATAAARIRRIDEFAEIILVERGEYISYANCGLPYYIGGVIPERENLFVQTPESFGKRFNVDVRVQQEVIKINPDTKSVEIRTFDGKSYTETYDKLLLSPGASPFKPPLEGIDGEGIFTLRNVSDTDRIKNYVKNKGAQKAVVVGAGFIGLEMVENLHHAGVEVTIVEMSNQVMAPVDFSIASQVHEHLGQKGVRLYLNTTVNRFERKGDSTHIFFSNGETIEADIVILSIGVRPETKLAKEAGLKIGEARGIWVDEYLQTSAKDVYAVGDAIEYPHPLTGKPWLNYLANPANRQGRIVADNMVSGNNTKYEGAIGTSIAKVFDIVVGSTGLAAKRLKQMEIPYESSTTHSNSHAGYYPNALSITLKLTFDPQTGKLYGAQGVGYDGIDKRIDQASLVIKKGGTIYDLIQLEHTYAPPFSSAKDPIAIAGYVAGNIISGVMPVIKWRDIKDIDFKKIFLLDVRTPDEFEMGAIQGAVNIPVDELRDRLSEIPRDKTLYIYCAVGLRGYLALKILKARGFDNVYNLSGGYKTYSAAVAQINKVAHEDSNDSLGNAENANKEAETIYIDACGLQCPGPILRLKKAMDNLPEGNRVSVISTDIGFLRDADAWCNTRGNVLISKTQDKGKYRVVVEKGAKKKCLTERTVGEKGKTFILFSDDLDKALATFVLANGAAATGEKVSIFFTFWGLNAIKKEQKPKTEKDFMGKMFSMMLPSSSKKLKLSKMNMMGMGSKMMRSIMNKKNIESLESLRSQALAQGVEFIACQMSMDVMGVNREELLDELTIGGVATYMERADKSILNLFI